MDEGATATALGEGVLTQAPRTRPRHGYDTSHWRPIRRNVRMLAAAVGIAALAILIAPPEGGELVVVLATMAALYAGADVASLLLATRRRRLSVRERFERRRRRLPWLVALGGAATAALGVAMVNAPEEPGDRGEGIFVAAVGVLILLGGVVSWTRRMTSIVDDVSLAADRTRVRRGDRVVVELAAEREDLECGLVCAAYYDVRWREEARGFVFRGRSPRRREVSRHLRRVDPQATRTVRVPEDAPFSFEGESLCVRWVAVARVPDVEGAFAPRAAVEIPIEVLP
ncbi:MAG: hypothetical protein M3340_19000 [Actinomycetota bacterium]|nr:hypothetical protein [Actinomycetota bacterium]